MRNQGESDVLNGIENYEGEIVLFSCEIISGVVMKRKGLNFLLNLWGSGACLTTWGEIPACNGEDESAAWKW